MALRAILESVPLDTSFLQRHRHPETARGDRMPTPARRLFPPRIAVALIIATGVLVSACAGHKTHEPLRTDLVIAVDRAAGVPPGSLFLKPLPGGLLGATVDDELFRSREGVRNVRVPLDVLSEGLARHAQPLRADRMNPGELVQPRGLRIARVGTFYEPLVRDVACNNFRTALRMDRLASAMLVYVDRPGRVYGTRYLQPYIVEYRLDFPRAGVYAITLRLQGMTIESSVAASDGLLRASVKRAPCLPPRLASTRHGSLIS